MVDINSTSLKGRLKKIIEELSGSRKKVKINIDGINADAFYTDVESTLLAIKNILLSMHKHTPKDSKIMISNKFDEDDVVFKITSNNIREIKGSPDNRNIIAHGKIRHAVGFLNGLCEYSIIAKYDEFSNWMERDMMNGKNASE